MGYMGPPTVGAFGAKKYLLLGAYKWTIYGTFMDHVKVYEVYMDHTWGIYGPYMGLGYMKATGAIYGPYVGYTWAI